MFNFAKVAISTASFHVQLVRSKQAGRQYATLREPIISTAPFELNAW